MKIELHLTLTEFEALRDHLTRYCTEYPHEAELSTTWIKVGEIEKRLQAARKLSTRLLDRNE